MLTDFPPTSVGHGGIAMAREAFLVGGLQGIDFLAGRECGPVNTRPRSPNCRTRSAVPLRKSSMNCRHSRCLLPTSKQRQVYCWRAVGQRAVESSHRRT